MSESRHTPGPWRVIGQTAVAAGGLSISQSWPIGSNPSVGFEEREANARLIASAPDLLAEVTQLRQRNAELREVLKCFIDEFDCTQDGYVDYCQVHFGYQTKDGDCAVAAARKLLAAEGEVKS